MSPQPHVPMATGSGKPRIVVEGDVVYTSSTNTTYTSTSVSETGSPTLTSVRPGMRISSFINGTPNKPTFGKVISATPGTTGIIAVDAWTQGAPTNANVYTIDGWVIDLPYCYDLTERFDPDNLVHNLYGGDTGDKLEVKFRGWKYQCTLDYAKYMTGDVLLSLAPALRRDTMKALVLIPHVDAPWFQYNVFFANPIELSRYGYTKGHSKIVVVFGGKENAASFPLFDGYGTNYAGNYGINL